MIEKKPALCLGYFQIDRTGDIPAAETECEMCGQPCTGGAWLAAMSDGTVYGPLCDGCAESN